MKDYRKFCRPKTIKNPLSGDYEVTLNCGGKVYVEKHEFEGKLDKFFKNYLVVTNHEENNHNYSQDYLTFVALEDSTFKFTNLINYSIDNGTTWIELASDTATPTIISGNKIMWKAELTPNNSSGIGKFSSTGRFNVEGNAMSLLFGDDFKEQTSLEGKDYALYRLFYDNTNVTSVENLSLPATTLANNCYYQMFQGCTSLATAPSVLPAITLAKSCYGSMFKDCTSLTTVPELPATTLADACYGQMFKGCTSLTTVPELPATTLTHACYQYMFQDCTSLTAAPVLPATTLVYVCYMEMFHGCTSLVTAPELPATTLADYCYDCMFEGCTSLVTAPELPATTLASYCYAGMFSGCTSLSSIKCLATNISASNCTNNWVSGVASSGTFTKASSMSSWKTGNNGIPSGWTVEEV